MTLDEFLVVIGMKADTKPAEKMQGTLDDVAKSAEKADAAAKKTGSSFGAAFGKALTIVGAFAATIKTSLMGAWAYLDSTIGRVKDLQNAEDASIRTTKEQVEMAQKYQENMAKMGKTIENVKTKIALAFLPTMYELSKTYAKFLDENKELIEKGIKVLLEWVGRIAQVFTNFAKFITLVIEKTIGWKGALLLLGAALLWINRAMIIAFATNPITWIIAAIGILLLLVDDFMTYLEGGDSLFGKYWGGLIDWINKVKAPLLALKESFLAAFDAISGAISAFISAFTDSFSLSDIFGLEGSESEEAESMFVRIANAARDFFQYIADHKDDIREVAAAIGKAFAWAAELIIGVLNGAGQVIAGFVSYVIDLFKLIVAAVTGDTEAMSAAWSGMAESAMQIFQGFFNFIGQILDSILQLFGTNLSAIGNLFKQLYNTITSTISAAVSFVVSKFNSILSAATAVVSSIGSIFSGVFNLITAPFGKAIDWVSQKFGALGSMVSSGISSMSNKASSLAASGSAMSGAVGASVANTSNRTSNFYGGNVQANINVSSPNANQAAQRTVAQLQNTASFANRNLKGFAKA